MLVMVFAIAMIPAVLFPILKGHNEALALGYVISRIVEVVALLPAAVAPLLLVELSAEYTAAGAPDAAHFRTLRTLLLTYDDWGLPVSKIAFCLGALILYYLLYRSILVPRFISVWGLVGAALYLADSLFVMFGLLASSSALQIAVTVPIAVNEMVLAVWLIVKGFNQPSAIVSGVTKTDIDKARQPSANW